MKFAGFSSAAVASAPPSAATRHSHKMFQRFFCEIMATPSVSSHYTRRYFIARKLVIPIEFDEHTRHDEHNKHFTRPIPSSQYYKNRQRCQTQLPRDSDDHVDRILRTIV